MPDPSQDKLSVHVNIKISAGALQAIVANAKKTVAKDANGTYRIDTADQVSLMITRFLEEKNFDGFAMDARNYENPTA